MKYFTLVFCFIFSLSFSVSAQLLDGSFEDGYYGTAWTQASTNFGTPLCSAGCGDCGGPCGPNTGSFYAWFGGAIAIEAASLEQSLIIPLGTAASIEMMVFIATSGPGGINDRLELTIDGDTLTTITAIDTSIYGLAYTLSTTDITNFADSLMHTIRLDGFQTTDTSTNILVDDIVLKVDTIVSGLFPQQLAEEGLFLYPNLADDVVNLEFRQIYGSVKISVSSLNGVVISQENIEEVNGRTLRYDTSSWEDGMYLINVSNEEGTLTKKMVVRH